MASIEQAIGQYERRQARLEHPDGKTDGGGRWYPSEAERQDCCNVVRTPSRAWPWSYMIHCRTLKHVAALNQLSERELRSALALRQSWRRPAKTAPDLGQEPTGESSGMRSISLAQAARQFDRHLAS